MAKKNKPKTVATTTTIEDAVAGAVQDLLDLGSECRDVADNLEEKFSTTQRYETMSNSAGTLESLSEPDFPDVLKGKEITLQHVSSNRSGRAYRCGEAIADLQAVVDFLSNSDLNENDEVKDYISEIEGIINEAESCEFPGMYG